MVKSKLIGRDKEIKIFNQILASRQAEFVALYGRRRVGKTYLVQNILSHKEIYLECTGIKDGKLHKQLAHFSKSMANVFYPGAILQPPKTWEDAFHQLTIEAKKTPRNKKLVIFLDELPWLASKKSQLLQTLDHYWNTEWSKLDHFKLIVCGSAASWMLNNLIHAKGGLHNRITKSIRLEPFDLQDTKRFLESKKIKLTYKQVLDVYLVMGGVPFYLNQMDPSKSVVQNINDLCFTHDGLLNSEFPRLFKSLFDSSSIHLKLIREIAKKRHGISFVNLASIMEKKMGGRFLSRLAELEAAGFIQRFLPYGKKKRDHFYKICDEYSLFYIKWIEDIAARQSIPKGVNYFSKIIKTPSWQSWSGYSFEEICYKHAHHVIHALGLNNISCTISRWQYIPSSEEKEQGAQIDLLIDREDDAISICEIKYSNEPFIIDKSYAKELINKLDVFQKVSQSKKQLFLVLITASGLKENVWSKEIVTQSIDFKDLYR